MTTRTRKGKTSQRANTTRKNRVAFLKGKLIEKRRRLLDDMTSGLDATVEKSGHLPEDSADIATRNLDHETAFQIGAYESEAVAQIDEALARIENGTYGRCEECDAKIPQARLQALPFARLCLKCQEEAERAYGGTGHDFLMWADDDVPEEGPHLAAESMADLRGSSRF